MKPKCSCGPGDVCHKCASTEHNINPNDPSSPWHKDFYPQAKKPALPANIDRNSDEYIFFTGTRGSIQYFQGVRFVPADQPESAQLEGTIVVWEVRSFDGENSRNYGIFKEWQPAMDFAVQLKKNWRNRKNFRLNRKLAVQLPNGEFYVLRGGPIRWREDNDDPDHDDLNEQDY